MHLSCLATFSQLDLSFYTHLALKTVAAFLSEINLGHVMANYQHISKLAYGHPQIPFHKGFFKNKKGHETSFQAIFF